MKISVNMGEFYDKLTILMIKFNLCTNPNQVMSVWKEIEAMSQERQPFEPREGLSFLVLELRNINQQLWQLEEEVREERSDLMRLKMSDDIRELNKWRSEVKAKISHLFGDSIEVKDYATGKGE